jgi:uncharacterized protein (DUF2235 family)
MAAIIQPPTTLPGGQVIPFTNPAVAPPEGAPVILNNRKRLIVLCDGTWQDSTSDDPSAYPTNVTRMARVLSPNSFVPTGKIVDGKEELEEVAQIVYYQEGVGTGIGDKVLGGAAGAGLSSHIRAAYAFLAENYDAGDTIYIFGFSRGAYTARSLAGLVVGMGLLTKRGMDNFPIIYNAFYTKNQDSLAPDVSQRLIANKQLINLPRGTVEIVGVWDTVGFYAPLPFTQGEYEFNNTLLSEEYKYAFHGLSLDENRQAFAPTLWFQWKDPLKARTPQATDLFSGPTDLQQVWFSGAHSDVGGGMDDPRLADISLAWMIAQCTKHKQLSFNMEYLLTSSTPTESKAPWATAAGVNSWWGAGAPMVGTLVGSLVVKSATAVLSSLSQLTKTQLPLAYFRTPGKYTVTLKKPLEIGDSKIVASMSDVQTHEKLHASITDRVLRGSPAKGSTAVSWPCAPYLGKEELVDQFGTPLAEADLLDDELLWKNNIRSARSDVEKDKSGNWVLAKVAPKGPAEAAGGVAAVPVGSGVTNGTGSA